jgi:hypothetical protein
LEDDFVLAVLGHDGTAHSHPPRGLRRLQSGDSAEIQSQRFDLLGAIFYV